MREWFATTPTQPRLESEPLIRVFFAELGSRDDLLAAIDAVADSAAESRARLFAQISGYLTEDGPFPQRWHVIGVGARALLEHAGAMQRWAAAARREVQSWDSTSAEIADARGRKLLKDLLREYGEV